MNTQHLKKSHSGNLEKAGAYLDLLMAASTPEAGRMAIELRAGIDESVAVVDASTSRAANSQKLKKAFKAADAKLKLIVGGTYAVIESSDPELFATLPPQETWTSVGGAQQAEHLIHALEEHGKEAKGYIPPIQAVVKLRAKAEKAWVTAGTAAAAMNTGSNAVAKLKLLIAQADVLLRQIAEPGTPLFALLKQAQGGKRKAKKSGASGDKKTQPAGDTKKETTGQQPATSTTPAQQPAGSTMPAQGSTSASPPASSSSVSSGNAAPPTGSAAPLPDAQPAVNVVVPAGASALTNGVHV